ncbi:MAG: hypothetical protein AB7F43_10910 [Bacteriovoracia bacterium]
MKFAFFFVGLLVFTFNLAQAENKYEYCSILKQQAFSEFDELIKTKIDYSDLQNRNLALIDLIKNKSADLDMKKQNEVLFFLYDEKLLPYLTKSLIECPKGYEFDLVRARVNVDQGGGYGWYPEVCVSQENPSAPTVKPVVDTGALPYYGKDYPGLYIRTQINKEIEIVFRDEELRLNNLLVSSYYWPATGEILKEDQIGFYWANVISEQGSVGFEEYLYKNVLPPECYYFRGQQRQN